MHPAFAGVRTWVAALIAATATLTGFAIEAGSGHRELGSVFAVCYVLGCIAAVLAVRQSGIFTAVVQPPLVLFVAVPLAYYFFHGSSFNGLKDVIISCGYPLIERFPLMLFTSAAVLLIGMIRWYLKMPGRPDAGRGSEPPAPSPFAGLMAAVTKLRQTGPGQERRERPRHTRSRPEEPADPPRAQRPRPPRDPRTPPPPMYDPRQRRDPRQRDPRQHREPRQYREPRPYRDPRDHRDGYYPPRPVREQPRRRPVPDGYPPSHHPVSRVRYRDSGGEMPGDYPEQRRR